MAKQDLLTPKADGIDHVNVYSRSKNEEGKLLSNFAPTPFVLHGIRFASVEGFYQAMLYEDESDRARIAGMWGAEAKAVGARSGKQTGDPVRTFSGAIVPFRGEAFHDEFQRAVRAKVEQNITVRDALVATERLPLTHYYVIAGKPITPRNETGRFTGHLMALRRELGDEATVARILGAAGALPAKDLVAMLHGSDDDLRLGAARALAFCLDCPGAEVVEALADMLASADARLSQRALRTLVQLPLTAEVAVGVFRTALGHGAQVIRAVAAKQLGRLGPAALPALDALRLAQKGSDKLVCRFATAALAQMAL